MLADDDVVRCATFPKLSGDGLSLEAVFSFDEENGYYIMSVGLGHLMPSEAARHEFGYNIVRAINRGRSKRIGAPLEPHQIEHYLGFYTLSYGSFSSIKSDLYCLSLTWRPEDHAKEHGDAVLARNGRDASDKALKTARKNVRKALARLSSGPLRSISPEDTDIADWLNARHLPPAPPED